MNLKKQIGSLCIFGFKGTVVPQEFLQLMQEWNLGGVILFKRNIESKTQVKSLNQQLQSHAAEKLFLSVDHEGGRVFRLPEPFTKTPPLFEVGNRIRVTKNPALAFELGQLLAREIKEVGFNVNYAPVCDVNSNPNNPIIGDRAFSADPLEVAYWCTELLQGLLNEGVWGCAKHFPGHGDTKQDSHLELPVIEKSLVELQQCELIPFQHMIAASVPLLMTAHIKFPALDVEWPATLSKNILTGLLKNQMNYRGLIISDDFEMKGIAAYYDIPQAVEQFLRAGGDIPLICHEYDLQLQCLEHLVKVASQDASFVSLIQQKSFCIAQQKSKLFNL